MKKLADFLVDRRYPLLAVMLAAALVCAFLAADLKTNKDMTDYLPEESNMRQGLDIMDAAFPDGESASVRVMFNGLDEGEIAAVREKLERIPNVSAVAYESDGKDYNRDGHTLFVVSASCGYGTDEERAVEDAIGREFSGYDMVYRNNDVQSTKVTPELLAGAVAMALAILIIMSQSWLEPVLFAAAIGVAIVINLGTNVIFPYVSELTASIGPIIQLVLSMDYSIILMNRYRQEKAACPDKTRAMKNALRGSFSSIASSALTTVAGLLALVLLSFKMGPELAIVLAKGVFISMLCVFTVLPVLILACDRGIEISRKAAPRIPMRWAAAFSYKARFVMPVLFIGLLAGSYILQRGTGITFTEGSADPIAEVFPRENTVALVYGNRDEENIPDVIAAMEGDEHIRSVTGYANTLGRRYDAPGMARALAALDGGPALDDSLVRMLYYAYFSGGDSPAMTAGEFAAFLQNDVLANESFASWLDEDMVRSVGSLGRFSDMEALTAPMTADEMASLLGSLTEGVAREQIELLYLYYGALYLSDGGQVMSIPELFDFLCDSVPEDGRFAALIDGETARTLADARDELREAAAQLRGQEYSRLIFTTDYPEESEQTAAFMEKLDGLRREYLAEPSYLVGTPAMVYEMDAGFAGEYRTISLVTAAAIFLVVLLTFRSLAVPALLTLLVQCGVYITVTVIGLFGGSMYYLALLIVQSILMGATIDYGIVFSAYYREKRRTLERPDALQAAYDGSIHTIMTSGSILVLVLAVLGLFASSFVAQVCQTLSIGSLVAMVLILFMLPPMLACFDRFLGVHSAVSKDQNGYGRST